MIRMPTLRKTVKYCTSVDFCHRPSSVQIFSATCAGWDSGGDLLLEKGESSRKDRVELG